MFTSGSKGNKVVSFAPGTDESDKEDKPGNNNYINNYSTKFYFSVHSIQCFRFWQIVMHVFLFGFLVLGLDSETFILVAISV